MRMPDVNGNKHSLWPKDLPSTCHGHSVDNIIKNFGVNKPEEYIRNNESNDITSLNLLFVAFLLRH